MTVTDALNRFMLSMDGVLSDATIRWYRSRLSSFVTLYGDKPVSSITIDDLRLWRSKLANSTERWSCHQHRPSSPGRLSPESIHAHVRAAQRLFKWLTDEDIISKNPALRLEKPQLQSRRKKGISITDRDAIIDAAYKSSTRDYAIVLILADTACRVGGVAGLSLCDLDLIARSATVTEKGKGGGKSRSIYFTTRTVEAIAAYLSDRPLSYDDHVFLSAYRPYLGLRANGIYQVLKRLARDAGVPSGWNPHQWRHGAIRAMLDNGMPLPAASEIAGHSSCQITGDIYGSYPEARLQQMHDQYSWIGDTDGFGDNDRRPG